MRPDSRSTLKCCDSVDLGTGLSSDAASVVQLCSPFSATPLPGGYASSTVRDRVKAKQPVRGMVHRKVERYIQVHNLYE